MSTSRRLVNLPLVLALESLFQIPRPYLHVFEIQKGEVADLENNKDFLKVDNDGGGGCSGGGEGGGGGGDQCTFKDGQKKCTVGYSKIAFRSSESIGHCAGEILHWAFDFASV